MPIIGFNFDKINIEKLKKVEGKVSIKHNIGIKDVNEEKLLIGKSEEVLNFSFEYEVQYEPKIGNLLLKGTIIYLDEPKRIKEIMKNWKKNKKLPQELMSQLINTIMFRCNIRSLSLSQEVNLPPHIPLPKVSPSKRPEDYIG